MTTLDRTDEFLLREYAALRNEIEGKADEIRSVIRDSLLATGAIWAWFATQSLVPGFSALRWLPLALSLLFSIQYFSIVRDVSIVATYLHRIEAWFDVHDRDLGWEAVATPNQWGIFWVSALYWTCLIVGNTLIPLLLPI